MYTYPRDRELCETQTWWQELGALGLNNDVGLHLLGQGSREKHDLT